MKVPFLSAHREDAGAARLAVFKRTEQRAIYDALKTVPGALYFGGNATKPASFRYPNGTVVEVR